MIVTRVHFRRLAAGLALAASAAAVQAGCATAGSGGTSPSFLIIEALEGASGAEPNAFHTIVYADVQTIVDRTAGGQTTQVPTVFSDPGRVTFRLGLKDPGPSGNPNAPSTINEITVTRYRVQFRRADGRNTPGVDVPYGFDGGMTVTVPANGSVQGGFELVRHQAKEEPPLASLVRSGGAGLISTIAEVTFWGRDQAGNEVTVTGSITVNFGDFGDPA